MPIVARLKRSRRPRRRKRRLRTVSTIPTLLTLGNLICGFAAIQFCLRAMLDAGALVDASADLTMQSRLLERLLPSFLAIAAGFIFVGLLLDALDGSVARLTKGTTDFGGQLDSLADMVTFGAAPALLVMAILMAQPDAAAKPGPLANDLWNRAFWVMVAVYVACTGMRLARFNVEHARSDLGHNYFSGLPSPGAAVVVASLVLLHEDLAVNQELGSTLRPYLALALPFIALGLGLLMVSRIPYIHLANAYLRGRRPFGQVVGLMVLLAIFWWYKELTVAVVVGAYAASGPIAALLRRVRPGYFTPLAQSSPSPAHTAETPPADKEQRSA
ncbi:MAG TPA: CDP-alcohol phosphatidyltransferase family protein [Phycisphaerae bacterium]|nr:CDP-alcohol phosphatidyltransferase family protein [Phycisphaerae bacterium]